VAFTDTIGGVYRESGEDNYSSYKHRDHLGILQKGQIFQQTQQELSTSGNNFPYQFLGQGSGS
jgi:hypothetical protein